MNLFGQTVREQWVGGCKGEEGGVWKNWAYETKAKVVFSLAIYIIQEQWGDLDLLIANQANLYHLLRLKGLCHQIELTFGDMNVQIYSVDLNKGRGRF